MTRSALLAREEGRKTLSAQVPLGTFFPTRKQTHNIPSRQTDTRDQCYRPASS